MNDQFNSRPRYALHHADWLEHAPRLADASIDLMYVDPPFNTGAAKRKHDVGFIDSWPDTGSYVQWLGERLDATMHAFKPTSNIMIHVDWRTSHHVRLMLDELLGEDRFVNHLIWSYALGGSSSRRFARKHDDILYYCIDPGRYWFDPPRVPATSRRMAGMTKKSTDVLDVPAINNMARERLGWPTQKPLALLDILVRGCCPPAGMVLDPCCGSGTTLHASLRAGRSAIGIDASREAIRISEQRLIDVTTGPARIDENSARLHDGSATDRSGRISQEISR